DFGGDELYKHAFIRAVKSLKSEGLTDYKKAKTSDIKNLLKSSLQSRFGTLFVLNNPKNKGAYEEFSLSLNFLNLTERGGRNCLLVGGLIEGMDLSLYNKIVHLDKPLSVIEIKGKEIIVNDEIEAFSLSAVKPYREDFISVYLKLVKIINAGVNCSINAYNQAITEFSFEQVAFSGEVFKELGFIKAGELLYLDKTVKKDLTESTIYKKLLKIKELL
ncbi:MAG: hypothetical protein J6Q38_05085, partial [Clostridia bacterium]|nr:hypothetical protein [Clostridia bacterium]